MGPLTRVLGGPYSSARLEGVGGHLWQDEETWGGEVGQPCS